VAPSAGTFKFYVMINRNAKVGVRVSGEQVMEIENTLFNTFARYQNGTDTAAKIE
jgi:hypothetical protein